MIRTVLLAPEWSKFRSGSVKLNSGDVRVREHLAKLVWEPVRKSLFAASYLDCSMLDYAGA